MKANLLLTFLFLQALCTSIQSAFAQITVVQNGSVGIRTTSPSSHLDVNGATSRFQYSGSPLYLTLFASDPRINSDNKVVFYNLPNTGFIDIQVRNVYEYSDANSKTNIQRLDKQGGSIVNRLKQINGVSYEWKSSKTGQKQTGFLAQEVEKAFPELVITADSTGGKMMSYTHMVPYLLEAIKEQQQTIENLTLQLNRLTELKAAESSISAPRKDEGAILPKQETETEQ